MDAITRGTLEDLMRPQAGLCVSLYLPTHKAGPALQQDPIRLKNLLRAAEADLVRQGLRQPEAADFLAPVRRLVEDQPFWRIQEDGLALFLSGRGLQTFRVPLDVPELAVVAPRFHIKPLLALFTGDGRFHVLALSLKAVRLLEATRFSVRPLPLAGVPRDLAEALRYNDVQVQPIVRSGGPRSGGGGGSGAFYGRGAASEEGQENARRFVQAVSKGLRTALGHERLPLLAAGVEHLVALLREVNGYPQLLDTFLPGNPDLLSDAELHRRAWEAMAPYFAGSRERAAAQYRELESVGRASCNLEQVLGAAHTGRVDSLFVAVGVQRWGRFDPAGNAAVLHADPELGDEDLLDQAATLTLLNRGTVFAVPPEQVPPVPHGAAMAAVFRY